MNNFAEKPLAIIGMGCRLPGADNLDEFWNLLIEGRSALGELPPDRMDRELQYSPQKGIRTRSYSCAGGVAAEQAFPAGSCPVPEWVINQSHSAHITLCNVAAAACRDAGLDPYALPTRNVGVYIGHTPPSAHIGQVVYARMIEQTAQYLREIRQLDRLPRNEMDGVIREIVDSVRSQYQYGDRLTQMRANAHHGPGLISLAFGLDGPSVAFDAACASSFRALGHGVRALQRGSVDMALVGGASYVHGDTLVVFSQAQSVSTSGSTPFDDKASGLVAAGGYVVLALKTLERAVADGDNIQAVICGLGVSSDGKGKSLWAPRQEGQIEAIARAYGHGMEFSELQFLEMHATSTQVGDATELGALTRASAGQFPPGTRIPIGSVKANIGHTLETAGIASLLKTVLAMKHGRIPPQINVEQPNTNVDWEKLPFFIPTQPLDWDRPSADTPRKAGVNAFGIGGLNVHIALREHIAETAVQRNTSKSTTKKNAVLRSSPTGEEEAVAVVGMGAIYPGARTIEHLWNVFREGRDQKTEVPADRWNKDLAFEAGADKLWKVPTATGGFINDYAYDWKRHKVPPKQIASADPLQFMLLDAADQALKDAGYDTRTFDRKRTGVIVGIVFGGEFADQLQAGLRLTDFQKRLTKSLLSRGVAPEEIEGICARYEELLLKHMPALIDETGSFTASTLASRITKTFDLMGGAVALDAGDCSSLAAVDSCVDLLLAGDCDMMICASGQRAMGIPTFEWMTRYELLSTSDPHGPFDARSTGCVPGEGVGALILKRLSDARRDGDRVHAIIRGIGVARSDSRKTALQNAMKRGLESAGLGAQNVSLLEAGSSGIAERDRDEILAAAEIYGSAERAEPLRIGAVAGQMGHIGGGLGMASLIKAVSELQNVEMTSIVDLREPIPELKEHSQKLCPVTAPCPLPGINADERLYAGVTSYSNHNLAYHLLLEGSVKVPVCSPAVPARNAELCLQTADTDQGGLIRGGWQPDSSHWRIVRFSANSTAELETIAAAAAGDSAAHFTAAAENDFLQHHNCRLAIVADSGDTLEKKLSLAARQLSNPACHPLLAEKGIFFGNVKRSGHRIAFLFPGQGSQYHGMLKSLVEDYPTAAKALQEIDAILLRHKLPSFADLAWKDTGDLGEDVWKTQLSLLIADTVVCSAALAAGLQADRVAGHSFGEIAALVAAGSWSFEDALIATDGRCKSISGCRNAGGLLVSTNAGANIAERICRDTGSEVSISHFNAPEQTVIGGTTTAVRMVAETLKTEGFMAKILDVPAAFHTPLMEEVKVPFREYLAPIPMTPPLIPLLSSVTNRYVSDPHDIRDNLVLQMTMPVNYVQLVQRLADEGVTAMVEVGPRQVLTGLHRQILTDKEITIVGCDHPKRNGLEQLLCARACLEVTGALDNQEKRSGFRLTSANVSDSLSTAAGDSPAATVPIPVSNQTEVPAPDPGHVAADELLVVSGTPFEMGYLAGQHDSSAIRAVLRRYSDLAGSRWNELTDDPHAFTHPELYFGPADLEELRGMAAGAQVSAAALISHNLRMFHNACAGGLHFAVSQNGQAAGLVHAVNADVSRALKINDCIHPSTRLRRPTVGCASVTFGITGQVGSLCGVNSCGVAVSTSTLMDIEPDKMRSSGRLITVLIREILDLATDIESAIAILRSTDLSGAWTLCISERNSGRVCFVEFDGQSLRVQPEVKRALAANHQQLMNYTRQSFAKDIPAHSGSRLNRLKELLSKAETAGITPDAAKTILRDQTDESTGVAVQAPTMHTLRRIDNQFSVVMQPSAGIVWVAVRKDSNSSPNEFRAISIEKLFDHQRTPSKPLQHPAASGREFTNSAIDSTELARSYADAGTPELIDGSAGICSRFVMRVTEQPLAGSPTLKSSLPGRTVILGDNAAGRALLSRLQTDGIKSDLLPCAADADAVIADLEKLWGHGPISHLFLMTAMDQQVTSLDESAWKSRQLTGVMVPYLVCQRWFQLASSAGILNSSTLTAATSLGGDFGFSGNIIGVDGGAITGLVKGIRLELQIAQPDSGFRAKVVDFPATETAETTAVLLCQEVASQNDEIEVGYLDGRRFVVRPVLQTVRATPERGIKPGMNVVITGGARGITAVVAREIGMQLGARLQLIGSSPFPDIPDAFRNPTEEQRRELKAIVMKEALAEGRKPVEAWEQYSKAIELDQTLKSFSDAGIQASYHACDISDRAALGSLLTEIRAQYGPIQGVIHGAGFERAARFDRKTPQLVSRTIAVKVEGAANLMALTAEDPLQFFAAFGSVSGRFGGVGQTDYCAANDMLAKLVDWYRRQRPELGATTFHWHAWDDVGMAMRPESKHIRKMHDITFMPSREGTLHLLAELQLGLPESEIIITELKTCRERFGHAETTPAKPDLTSSLPLIDSVLSEVPGRELIAELKLDPQKDVFLRQHLFKGKPLLPVVVAMEALCEAAVRLAGSNTKIAALQNIEIVNGLRFAPDASQTAHLRASAEENIIRCELTCDFINRRGIVIQADRPYLRADVALSSDDTSAAASSCSSAPDSEWQDVWYPEEDAVIYHGPVFRRLRQITVDERSDGWARLVAPSSDEIAGERRGDRWLMPSALLDGCFFACGAFLWFLFEGVVAIPAGIREIRFGRMPRVGENCLAHIWFRDRQDDQGIFDVHLFGEDGEAILEVDGYRNIIVAQAISHVS
jgi:acyl transferase domain-containing protein/NAD(P)-dependent dehydrogenase (short-subunit alcohol dehydrogenase family)